MERPREKKVSLLSYDREVTVASGSPSLVRVLLRYMYIINVTPFSWAIGTVGVVGIVMVNLKDSLIFFLSHVHSVRVPTGYRQFSLDASRI